MRIGTDIDARYWETDVVVTRFVAALHEGLARSAPLRTRVVAEDRPAEDRSPGDPPPGDRPAAVRPSGTRGGGPVLADPFATAVLNRYQAALTAMLAPVAPGDRELRAALLRRGAAVLAEASCLAGLPAVYPGAPVNRRPSAEQEAMALNLLMECAVLTALRDQSSWPRESRTADLVEALGRAARRALARAHSAFTGANGQGSHITSE